MPENTENSESWKRVKKALTPRCLTSQQEESTTQLRTQGGDQQGGARVNPSQRARRPVSEASATPVQEESALVAKVTKEVAYKKENQELRAKNVDLEGTVKRLRRDVREQNTEIGHLKRVVQLKESNLNDLRNGQILLDRAMPALNTVVSASSVGDSYSYSGSEPTKDRSNKGSDSSDSYSYSESAGEDSSAPAYNGGDNESSSPDSVGLAPPECSNSGSKSASASSSGSHVEWLGRSGSGSRSQSSSTESGSGSSYSSYSTSGSGVSASGSESKSTSSELTSSSSRSSSAESSSDSNSYLDPPLRVAHREVGGRS